MTLSSAHQDLIEQSNLTKHQKDDLLGIYPYLVEAQQKVVSMHTDAALRLLLEKILELFREKIMREKNSTRINNADLALELDNLLHSIGLKTRTPNIAPSFIYKMSQKFPEFFEPGANSPDVTISIQGIADYLSMVTKTSNDIFIEERVAIFTLGRHLITDAANQYEKEINDFINKKDPDSKESIEGIRYQRELRLWRDGIIEGTLPIYPRIDGFPIPPKVLSKIHRNPMLLEIDNIANNVVLYARTNNLPIDDPIIKITESGQKGLSRIIEKTMAYRENKLPSDIPDLARAMPLISKVADCARFEELYAVQLHQADCSSITPEGWQMRKSGFHDTRTTAKIAVGGKMIPIESRIMFPEQRKADLKVHLAYQFVRSKLAGITRTIDIDHESYINTLKEYNELIGILDPRTDRAAGFIVEKFIHSSCQNRTNNFTEDNATSDIIKSIRTFAPIDINEIQRPHDKKIIIRELMEAMDKIHMLYYIAAATHSGGTTAAVFNALFQRDNIAQGPAGKDQNIINLLPKAGGGDHTVYRDDMGVYTTKDECEALLILNKPINPISKTCIS